MPRCVTCVALLLGACSADAFSVATMSPGLRATVPALRPASRTGRVSQLKMGMFDVFKNAFANEDLGAPPPDGLSQDPWLSGMRKTIIINFVKDGEVVAKGEGLPGDKIKDVATKAKVTLPESCMMKANDVDVQVSPATSRIPAPERRNLVAEGEGEGEMMDSGLSAPVWTNFSQRGEVRTVTVKRVEYFVYI